MHTTAIHPAPELIPLWFGGATVAAHAAIDCLRLPFDTARVQYARSVQAGLIERSMLASRDFECALGSLEQITLGPLARRV